MTRTTSPIKPSTTEQARIRRLGTLAPETPIDFGAISQAVGIQLHDVPTYLRLRDVGFQGGYVRAGDLMRAKHPFEP